MCVSGRFWQIRSHINLVEEVAEDMAEGVVVDMAVDIAVNMEQSSQMILLLNMLM